MTKMVPRDYQDYATACVMGFDFEMGTKSPLVAAPTGTGKSLMIAALIRALFNAYGQVKIMVLADVKELIEQNHEKMLALWPGAPAGIFSAGLKRKDTRHPIIFGGIGSVANCPLYFGKVDFLLVDECHMISLKESSQYQSFIADLRIVNPYLCIVGYTATKFRTGQGLLTEGDGAIFTDICCDMTTMEAFNGFLDQGYLCRLRPIVTEMEFDSTGIRTVAGEYNIGDMQKAYDKQDLTRAVIEESVNMGKDKNCWLVFASGVEHTIHVAEELCRQGINATYVHSNSKANPMSDGERDQRIADFKAGKYQAMVNNGILTKGFDHPAIDFIVLLRKTKSVVLWIQMLGRGTRPYYCAGFDLSTVEGRLDAILHSQKPYCLVADFAGNVRELGPINDPRIPQAKGKKTPGDAPIRICDHCGTYNHASATHCSHCGREFPRVLQLEVKASKQELIKTSEPPKPIVVEIFKVKRVEYHPHFKAGKMPSIRVDYYCGLRRFSEWVCLEHQGAAATRAKNWWRERALAEPPDTTQEALVEIQNLKVPLNIHVRMEEKNPQIVNYDYI